MCRVSHPSLEKPTEKGSGPLQVQAKPKIRKSIKPSMGIGEMVFCQILENFYPKDIQIEWYYWSGEKLEQRCPSEEKYTTKIDKTFSVESKCRVPEDLLHSPDFRVRVTWRHESMDEEELRELSIRDKDFSWRPKVEMSVPPLRIGEEATIQCRVTKYFPNAVTIMWFRKDNQSREMCPVSSDERYKITNIPLERPNDKTYGSTSCVTFTPSLERDQCVEYVCRVDHPSLEQPIEKSTGALQVTEPEHQNQLPQPEDNWEVHQDHNMGNMCGDDSEMPSDPEEANLDSSGVTYAKNAQNQNKLKHSSQQYGPRHASYGAKDQEKKLRNPSTKKRSSDKTFLKLQQSSKDSSDP